MAAFTENFDFDSLRQICGIRGGNMVSQEEQAFSPSVPVPEAEQSKKQGE